MKPRGVKELGVNQV